jgi:hypothetical protein
MKLASAVAFALALAAMLPGSRNALSQHQPLIGFGACAGPYDPVCARSRKKVLITYPNACLASSDRAKVIAKGACPEACPTIYSPVCAIDDAGHRKTYGNACQAKTAGARLLSNRRCGLTLRRQ